MDRGLFKELKDNNVCIHIEMCEIDSNIWETETRYIYILDIYIYIYIYSIYIYIYIYRVYIYISSLGFPYVRVVFSYIEKSGKYYMWVAFSNFYFVLA